VETSSRRRSTRSHDAVGKDTFNVFDTTLTMFKILGALLGIASCIGLVYVCIVGLAYLLDHSIPLQAPIDGTTTPFQDAVVKCQLPDWKRLTMFYVISGSVPFMLVGTVVWVVLERA
jgi:hypothetical protein